MARITRLTENDLARIVRRVIVEQNPTAGLKSVIRALPGVGGTPTTKGVKPAIGATTGGPNFNYNSLRPCKPGEEGKLVKQSTIFALSRNTPFCKIVITDTVMEQNVKSAARAAGNALMGGSSASNSTPRTTTPPPPRTTTPPLKTIVFTDPSLTKTRTNIDIVPNSIRLVSNNVIFSYRVAGANTKPYMGSFNCSSNNKIMLNGNSGANSIPSFISPKRAATLKSKCAVNQGYASTNTGVDTTLA